MLGQANCRKELHQGTDSSAFRKIENQPSAQTEAVAQQRPLPQFLPENTEQDVNMDITSFQQLPSQTVQQQQQSPPTKLPRDSSILAGDETDYKSPPSRPLSSSSQKSGDFPGQL